MEGTDEFGRALELEEPDDKQRWLLLAVAGGLALAGIVLYAITKRQLTERATALAPSYPDGWETSLTHATEAWDLRWANMLEELEELRARVNGTAPATPATNGAGDGLNPPELDAGAVPATVNAGQMPTPEPEPQPSSPPQPAAVSMQPGAE